MNTLPRFYDPKNADRLYIPNKGVIADEANEFVNNNKLEHPAKDDPTIAMLLVDVQLDFCHPDGSLFVGGASGTGAVDDTRRTAEFIYKNLEYITDIKATLDTHRTIQIFHPVFWVDEQGNHPAPMTMITLDDINAGKFRVNPKIAWTVGKDFGLTPQQAMPFLMNHVKHYVKTLENNPEHKYPLTIWPYHVLLGDMGHPVMPIISEAMMFHSLTRGTLSNFEIKGANSLTENYSVFSPEVTKTVTPKGQEKVFTQRNTDFLNTLIEYDKVIICGQAKSHCVAWTIYDLLGQIKRTNPELAKKVLLLEDCTSPVVVPGVIDFTQQADEAFAYFEQEGMKLVKSTENIQDWI